VLSGKPLETSAGCIGKAKKNDSLVWIRRQPSIEQCSKVSCRSGVRTNGCAQLLAKLARMAGIELKIQAHRARFARKDWS